MDPLSLCYLRCWYNVLGFAVLCCWGNHDYLRTLGAVHKIGYLKLGDFCTLAPLAHCLLKWGFMQTAPGNQDFNIEINN